MSKLTEAVFSMQCSFIAKNAAAWAGDILTLPENYGREADVKTVARFTDEIRSRLNLLDEWAGREEPEAADEIERITASRDGYAKDSIARQEEADRWKASATALKAALAPLAPALTAILAEAPRDSKGSDEFNLFTDCEGNEYCVTLDQIRAVVEIGKSSAAIGKEGGENTCGDR